MSDAPRPDSAESPASESLRDGRYGVLGVLGSGAQGDTLEAKDRTTGAHVAIKRFNVRGARSWKDVELAEREARVLSQLDHPNLPRYIEHFEENGALYLVTEKIEGRTLGELRRARLGLSETQLLRFFHDAAEALRYLHGRAPPLIHRDIKPNNVILRPDGSFVLVDFGSVRDHLRPDGGSTVVGTFGYMAPEQFQGRALPASDVYGVGATAIACLTGEEPENLPHQGLAIDVPRALGRGSSAAVVALLSELLEPNPDRRPSDLSRALSRHLGGARFRDERSRRPPSEHDDPRSGLGTDFRRRRRRPHRRFAPVVLVVLVGLLVARFATFGLFRVMLPLLLGLLALFFGAGLRRAAERTAAIGRAGESGLRRAAQYVLGHNEGRPRDGRHYRVDEEPEAELDEDADDFEHDEPGQRRARRR